MCWVHKPGVPRGPASTPGLGLGKQHTVHGPVQESKNTTGRKGSPVADRKVYPKERVPVHQLLRPTSPTEALASGTSHLQAVSPIGRPGPKRCFRLQPCDRGSWEPCSPLFSDRRTQSRLERSDRGHPIWKEPEDVRRKARHGSQVKTTIPGTIPCTKQCSAATLTQSIVEAAKNSHTVSPPRVSGHRSQYGLQDLPYRVNIACLLTCR